MTTATLPPPADLCLLIERLEHRLLERGAAVRLVLLAALAGEHVLLIGPPGTAKSELARRLHWCFEDARYFERLLTRFSTPEELFGPLSLKALEEDRYERLVDGYLPTATVGFLDEVFKANSAILNALLTLLNEREFDNGAGRARTPLVSVIGATNEPPADESLLAFHDRFLLRVPVQPVGDASFEALLRLHDDAEPPRLPELALSRAQLRAIAAARDAIALPADVVAHLASLRDWTRAQSMPVSDRRWRQLVGLLRTQAASEHRAAVDRFDLWLVPYVVAAEPSQIPAVARWFATQVAAVEADDAPWLARAVEAFEQQLRIEQSMPPDDDTDGAGKLALARAIGHRDAAAPAAAGADLGSLRIVAAALEDKLRRRWSAVHVAARVAQLDEVTARATLHREPLAAQAAALRRTLGARLWIPAQLTMELIGTVEATLAVLDALIARLGIARAGFAALPIDAALADAPPPEPLALSA